MGGDRLAVAFYSEPLPGGREGRNSYAFSIGSCKELEELVSKYGTPNLLFLENGEILLEGRDWTRRERENVPPCFEQALRIVGALKELQGVS